MQASSQQLSEFETLLLKKEDLLGPSVFLILAWITTSDGHLGRSEKQALHSIAKSGNHLDCVELIVNLALKQDIAAIQLACEIIRVAFPGSNSSLFMEMAIGTALADRQLLPSENYILRFLGDLLGLSRAHLDSLFSEVTGKPLPEIPDVSSRHYWGARKTTQSQQKRTSQSGTSSSNTSRRPANRFEKAHATLGLDPGASKESIKAAYRRLAKVHHPDRFHSLGKEAVEAAHVNFTRIQDAYNYLTSHA